MSAIEKMYTLAMVAPTEITVCGIDEEIIHYPPFTAEKQIELIKWLSEHYLLEIRRIKDTHEYYIGFNGYKKRVWNATMNFENTLAKLINNFWQDLTDAEKSQIKEILE